MGSISSYDGEVDMDRTLKFYSHLALAHCDRAGPTSSSIRDMINASDWKGLCAVELDYKAIPNAFVAAEMRQALGFFQKLEDLDIGVDKVSVAKKSFYASEGECLRTNSILDKVSEGSFCFPKDVQRVISLAERKIASVLGEVPSISSLDYLFGPGATTSVQKRNACARTKLSAVPSCSSNMIPLLPVLLEELQAYCALHDSTPTLEVEGKESYTVPVEIHHGRIAFVPKNAKTYRSVMTEPTLNALVQSGIGRLLNSKLKRVGLDLRDQTQNQWLACIGSLTGDLATLDLSGASDSLSSGLVAQLLPYEWYALLSLCRTPTVRIDGKVLRLHKFCSMGNGFTFPLQTLIFWALAKASCELSGVYSHVNVYGDDIIIDVQAVPLFKSVLNCTGFKLNDSKSFWSGPFRESCGKDYFSGFDIRPFYAKKRLSGRLLFLLHNFYVRNKELEFADLVLEQIDPSLRLFGPDGYGDGHLITDRPPLKPYRRDRGYEGFTFETFTTTPKYHFSVMPGDSVLPAYTVYVRSFAQEGDSTAPTKHKSVSGCDDIPMIPLSGSQGIRRIRI